MASSYLDGDQLVQEPSRPRLRDVGINDQVLAAVRSLTYASFDMDGPPASTDAPAMETWQVEHATAILQECPELDSLRFTLCPKCALCQPVCMV